MSPAAQNSIAVGTKAPDFTLQDDQGKTVHLHEALGSNGIVLIFYPGDMTPGCTVQLCSIRDDWAKFTEAGIQVYGVNQADAKSHRIFRETHKLPFPLLIDTDRSVSRAYGATRSILGLTLLKRTVVGIDSEGVIVFYRQGMPKDADILKAFSPRSKN